MLINDQVVAVTAVLTPAEGLVTMIQVETRYLIKSFNLSFTSGLFPDSPVSLPLTNRSPRNKAQMKLR